jgi:hypothetical protein
LSEDDIPSHRLFGDEPTGPHDALPPEVPGYVTERCIGEGASASVWLVRQERPFMRTAAMKVYRASSGGGAILGRFRSERDILARLPTTGFCALYDAGLCADGRPFICMEFIDGPNMLEACRAPGMYASRIGTLFLALLRTVAHAHSLGLIQRAGGAGRGTGRGGRAEGDRLRPLRPRRRQEPWYRHARVCRAGGGRGTHRQQVRRRLLDRDHV